MNFKENSKFEYILFYIIAFLMLILAGGIACMSAFAVFIFYIKSISDPLYADKESELNKKGIGP